MKSISPGKLILSGEHAVVYGRPALAMAVNRFCETTICSQLSRLISFNLLNLRYKDSFTLQTLGKIKQRLSDKYHSFLEGRCTIREVLQTPFELALFAFSQVLDHMNTKIKSGFSIVTHSTIPVGCGMGSSAAVTLSVIQAIARYIGLSFDPEQYLKLGFETERLQHGHPSGLDLYVSLHGGAVYSFQGKRSRWDIPRIPMYMVNTGQPSVTTGQCVEQVAAQFRQDPIWNDFESVTQTLCSALKENHFAKILDCIRENHKLLVKIGVVPEKVQTFIQSLEEGGAAAKICGAGAIQGDQGGMVLIIAEDMTPVQQTCKKYGYDLSPVQASLRGLHVI